MHRWTEQAAVHACLKIGGAWSKLKPSDVSVRSLKGGMSNDMFVCRSPGGKSVVVRFYGDQGDLVDKKLELRVFAELSQKDLGPKLLAVLPATAADALRSGEASCDFSTSLDQGEPIGRVEEFLEGWKTFTPADYKDEKQLADVANLVGKWHCTDMECMPKSPRLFHDLANLAKHVNEGKGGGDGEQWEKLLGRSADFEQAARGVVEELQGGFAEEDLVFCHNDLQYGNVMQEEASGRHSLIDFEYSGYNPSYYELANWFCELSADYSEGVAPCGFTMDVSETGFVAAERQRILVAAYLESRIEHGRAWGGGGGVDENKIEKFRQNTLRFVKANHLFWGMWGVLKAREEATTGTVAQEGDFDYSAYARNRLQWVL